MTGAATHAVLVGWTLLAVAWWVVAFALVARRRDVSAEGVPAARERLSVFKPVPPDAAPEELAALDTALRSLLDDFDDDCELLLAADAPYAAPVRSLVGRLQQDYPRFRIELLVEAAGHGRMHPKVSWNRRLAVLATGQLWWWSDADMLVPQGTMASLRREIAADANMVTSPYVVRKLRDASALLDALYVNAEFFPGVLLLGRVGAIAGGFGAGMLFRKDQFDANVDWNELGSHLADDYVLGQRLQPVVLGSATLETIPAGGGWVAAVLHYLRWQKTVRWMQPAGFAGQIIILPLIGWLCLAIVAPGAVIAWYGLGATLLLEALAALVICKRVNCRIPIAYWPLLPLWSLLRVSAWLACWLPWPVTWRGQKLWSPRLYDHEASG